jgi:hypothetical protein
MIQFFLISGKNNKFSFPIFKLIKNIIYSSFFYSQKFIDIDRIDSFIHIFEKLDTKQLKISSPRGFFLYPLETIENAKDDEILATNLQPFFWRKVKNIV